MVNSSPVTSLSYTDTTVSAGQTYYYVVTSVNATGSRKRVFGASDSGCACM